MELPFFPCQHQDRGPVWDIILSIYHPKSQPQALEEQHLLQRSKSREKHKCGDSWELKQANVGQFRFGLRRPSATPSQGASGDEKCKNREVWAGSALGLDHLLEKALHFQLSLLWRQLNTKLWLKSIQEKKQMWVLEGTAGTAKKVQRNTRGSCCPC